MVENFLAIGCAPVDILANVDVDPHRFKGIPMWEEVKRVNDRSGPDATSALLHN